MEFQDEKEKEFYEKVVNVLTKTFNKDLSKEEFVWDSGDNSVIMKGDCAGYSLWSLMDYVARKQGKKMVRHPDYFYYNDDTENEETV